MPSLLRYLGHRLYTTWATFWFAAPFVVTYPLQWALSRFPAGHPYLHALNRAWSKLFIRMWGVPVEVIHEAPLPNGQPCVYVPNHSSYIDIPLRWNERGPTRRRYATCLDRGYRRRWGRGRPQ